MNRFISILKEKQSWVLLALLIISIGLVRLRLLEVPLERDEGEYAYMGQLLLQGIPPYDQAYNMKFPGIYFLYAIILLFGQTHSVIHLALLIVNAVSILFVFLIAKRLFGHRVSVVASASFAVLSVSYHVEGLWANCEHFILPFALFGVFLFCIALEKNSASLYGVSGLLFGLALLVKQHGVFFGIFALTYLILRSFGGRHLKQENSLRNIFLFVACMVIPFILVCTYLYYSGVFDKFIFWTFTYATKYVTQVPLEDAWMNFFSSFHPIIKSTLLLWLLSIFGLLSLVVDPQLKDHRLFVISFFAFSFLSVCPGLIFRLHYFVLLLPAVSLMMGLGAESLFKLFAKSKFHAFRIGVPTLTAIIAIFSSFFSHKDVLFDLAPATVARIVFGGNPFPESLAVAEFIKQRTSKHDTIAIIGSEPQIFFYSQRHSASSHIYVYALMEDQPLALTMQQEMARQIEAASPKLLLYVHVLPSWIRRPTSQQFIFEWFAKYSREQYDLMALVEVARGNQPALFHVGLEASKVQPKSHYWISVYERKGMD